MHLSSTDNNPEESIDDTLQLADIAAHIGELHTGRVEDKVAETLMTFVSLQRSIWFNDILQFDLFVYNMFISNVLNN